VRSPKRPPLAQPCVPWAVGGETVIQRQSDAIPRKNGKEHQLFYCICPKFIGGIHRLRNRAPAVVSTERGAKHTFHHSFQRAPLVSTFKTKTPKADAACQCCTARCHQPHRRRPLDTLSGREGGGGPRHRHEMLPAHHPPPCHSATDPVHIMARQGNIPLPFHSLVHERRDA